MLQPLLFHPLGEAVLLLEVVEPEEHALALAAQIDARSEVDGQRVGASVLDRGAQEVGLPRYGGQ